MAAERVILNPNRQGCSSEDRFRQALKIDLEEPVAWNDGLEVWGLALPDWPSNAEDKETRWEKVFLECPGAIIQRPSSGFEGFSSNKVDLPYWPLAESMNGIATVPSSADQASRNPSSAVFVLAAAIVKVAFLYILPILFNCRSLSAGPSWIMHKASHSYRCFSIWVTLRASWILWERFSNLNAWTLPANVARVVENCWSPPQQ